MRGFPKNLNSKADLENLLAMPEYAAQALAEQQRMQSARKVWVCQKLLAEKAVGLEDATHKVIVQTAEGKTERLQMELVEDPGSKWRQFGLEAAEPKDEVLEAGDKALKEMR